MLERLKAQLAAEISGCDAQVSVLWQELDTDRVIFAAEPGRKMVSASVIKIPILLTVLEEVRRGAVRLDSTLYVRKGEILADSEVFDLGPRECTLEELLTWMIILSDNTSTNALIDSFGMKTVNSYLLSLGCAGTALRRKMLDFAAAARGRQNYISAEDCALLFSKLYAGAILTPELCRLAIHILEKQRKRDLLLRYIWEDVALASKTGGLEGLSHDAGVFSLPGKRYFLGVFIQNSPDPEGKPRLIGRISRLVYDYYTGGCK